MSRFKSQPLFCFCPPRSATAHINYYCSIFDANALDSLCFMTIPLYNLIFHEHETTTLAPITHCSVLTFRFFKNNFLCYKTLKSHRDKKKKKTIAYAVYIAYMTNITNVKVQIYTIIFFIELKQNRN